MSTLSNVTILILDDNPLVLKLGRALLEREGCTVLTASSWIEFNHVLAANSPDLILLDVNLPSIKGNRLSEVLKSQSNKREIPIVLISDLPERSLEEMFPSSGANAWMRKPLTREKLLDVIARFVPAAG
ncbi:MAG TPA: response regulator [Thermoanaerobaculia bacterium]|nr:response regulator [Thermoanaerobaculia bacterium]